MESGRPLDDPHGNDSNVNTRQETAILVESGGKLYFQNAFILSSTPTNMRIVMDAILNLIEPSLEGYRVVRLRGLDFGGIDFEGLDKMPAGRRVRGEEGDQGRRTRLERGRICQGLRLPRGLPAPWKICRGCYTTALSVCGSRVSAV